jgi:hypothetical protein
MAETILETILPGTYIEVRAEGLLTVGAIATGNVGVIGTADMGDTSFVSLASFDEARSRFGEAGEWDSSAPEGNLSLIRMLRLLMDNGARTVFARRVLDSDTARHATYDLLDDSGATLLTLRAKSPGAAGNRLQVRIEAADSDDARQPVPNELLGRRNGSFALSAGSIAEPTGAENGNTPIGRVTVREQGLSTRYQLLTGSPSGTAVQVSPQTRTLNFLTAPAPTAEVTADYLVPAEALRRVTIRYGNQQEAYVVPSLSYLQQRLEQPDSPSRLVEVASEALPGLPRATLGFEAFTGGDNGKTSPADLAEQFQEALNELVDQPVQIVVVGGSFGRVRAAVLGHVEKTENLGRERIAFLGVDADDRGFANSNDVADKRVVLVAPGIIERNGSGGVVKLPAYLAAAAVAGKAASVAPNVSLTNKALAGVEGISSEYNYGELKSLVQSRVLTLERKRGVRVVKAITTDDGAFRQISIRRIVDYAKEGTRQGASQYIGRLNNRRVRENLRTTLDSFLADMLSREYLTGYKLNVTADRAMEIRGEVLVEMDLNPTFSIDVIRVVMNLS